MLRDEECYERFLGGDRAALEELVSIHRQGLTLFLYGIVRDMPLAEDLMIDTFAQLVLSGSRYRRRSSLKTYIFTIGRNLAFRHLRVERELEHNELEDSSLLPDEVQSTVLAREKTRQLYDAMRRLNPDYCQALYLLYLEGMSCDEAGKVLGKTKKQMANLIYRAKNQLKTILDSEGFTYVD